MLRQTVSSPAEFPASPEHGLRAIEIDSMKGDQQRVNQIEIRNNPIAHGVAVGYGIIPDFDLAS